jgi:2-hydroxychromene-2-carboxylate isomerase
MPTIEFFFDFSSPYTYLASTRIHALAERTGAQLVTKPFVLGAVFKATGNEMPAHVPAKAAYMWKDLTAWAADYGVPFTLSPHFPVNSMAALRMFVALGDDPRAWPFAARVFRAVWAEEADIADKHTLHSLATELGLDADHLLRRIDEPDVKATLRTYTDDAIARGAFGAPTFFVGDQLFCGNDRLPFVERAARGERVYRNA